MAGRVAAPADGRAVLAARLAGARLRRHRRGDPEHRRLVRRLRRRGVPDAGALHRADADAGRQLGPRLAAGLAARAEPRRAPRGPAVLRPVAARRGRTGSTRSPPVVWFERDYAEPEAFPEAWPGRWRAADAYPASGDHRSGRSCSRAARRRSPAVSWSAARSRAGVDTYRHRRDGRHARQPCRGAPAGSRTGWRATSGRTRRWGRPSRARPSIEPLSILGEPVAILHLAVDAPVATAVVRLADVAPDGTSSWVSAGILNLTHRRSDTDPEPLVPGELVEVRVPLRHAGYRFEPGHAHPGLRGVVGVAGDLALPVSRRRSRSTAATRPRRGWSCR